MHPHRQLENEENGSRPDEPTSPPRHELEVVAKRIFNSFFPVVVESFRRVVKEEIELAQGNFSAGLTRNETGSPSCRYLQLKFLKNFPGLVLTGRKIKAEDGDFIKLALFDVGTGEVVCSGPESSLKIELVVLQEDFDGEGHDGWTSEEFNKKIVREKRFLAGNVFLTLHAGTVLVDNIKFIHASSWTRKCELRLGARALDTSYVVRVKEAKTNAFSLIDRRSEHSKKRRSLVPSDDVWRLIFIHKGHAIHERLLRANIKTVGDFLMMLSIDRERLKNILGEGTEWDETFSQAQSCTLNGGVYYHSNSQQHGVVFNCVGQLLGQISQCQYVPVDELTESTKDDLLELLRSAFELKDNVVKVRDNMLSFSNLASLLQYCQNERFIYEPRSLRLQFSNKISLPVLTGTQIKGMSEEESTSLKVSLVDAATGDIVCSGLESLAKVEIVVLEGDFDGNELNNWTVEEFIDNIVREREGRGPLLSGDVFFHLKDGIGFVGEISFTDNSNWTRSHEFRLGARVVDDCNGVVIQEAKTESFVVRDHLGEFHRVRHVPELDGVWRVDGIANEGAFSRPLRYVQENAPNMAMSLIRDWGDVPPLNTINPLMEENFDRGSAMSFEGDIDICDYVVSSPSSNLLSSISSMGLMGEIDELLSVDGIDSMDLNLGQPALAFPNTSTCGAVSSSQGVLREDGKKQYSGMMGSWFQGSSLQPQTNLRTDGRFPLGRGGKFCGKAREKARERWKMLFSVSRWMSIRRKVSKRPHSRRS